MDLDTNAPVASTDIRPARRASWGRRARRLAGTLGVAGAVAVGGVGALPSGLASAAGVDGNRLQLVATPSEGASTTTVTATDLSGGTARPGMKVRVDANGDVTVL